MDTEGRLWMAAWAILIANALLVLIFNIALSNDLIVFDGAKTDLSAVLLAASAVVLTGVGILIAVLALWGFDGLRRAVVKDAADEAESVAREVARSVAQTVATRVILERMQDTSAEQAQAIAEVP